MASQIVVIFGPPAAGKGTMAKRLQEKYDLIHLSTGDMLRTAADEGTELGVKAKEYMDRGELLPDELVIDIVAERIKQPDVQEKGVLLDGFPRTVEQAKALDATLGQQKVDVVLSLEVSDNDVLIKRMQGRAQNSDRADDNEETLLKRIETFKEQTLPVLDHYKAIVRSFNAEQDREDVWDAIEASFESKTEDGPPGDDDGEPDSINKAHTEHELEEHFDREIGRYAANMRTLLKEMHDNEEQQYEDIESFQKDMHKLVLEKNNIETNLKKKTDELRTEINNFKADEKKQGEKMSAKDAEILAIKKEKDKWEKEYFSSFLGVKLLHEQSFRGNK